MHAPCCYFWGLLAPPFHHRCPKPFLHKLVSHSRSFWEAVVQRSWWIPNIIMSLQDIAPNSSNAPLICPCPRAARQTADTSANVQVPCELRTPRTQQAPVSSPLRQRFLHTPLSRACLDRAERGRWGGKNTIEQRQTNTEMQGKTRQQKEYRKWQH